MKRISVLLCFIAVTAAAMAQPLLVGHRGSLWGVENTAEAFINGAKKGYHYLECDVKVAKDGTYILSHDDTTERLGGKLTIASSTIEQLKAETYTQTRQSVTYTGTICTVAEYLDICNEYGVKPVIELKWATGINNNDCSNLPGLISLVEEKGFRNKCIVLTSMKPCLEYIRKNYPDITLQFLTGQYWANHFDWCVEQGIDVDIQSGYFDKSTVTKFHDAGLKVNMWTANDNTSYRTYGNYGCDFITTDYLDPASLPELDASVTFPPNTTDYPNVEGGVIKGMYQPEVVASVGIPDALAGMEIRRAIVRGDKWYILALDADGNPILTVVNTETGEEIKRMNTTGLIALSDIAFTADGILLGCNRAVVPFAGGGDVWRVYKWASDDAMPETVISIDTADKLLCTADAEIGSTFAVSGRVNDLKIYVSALPDGDNCYRIAGVEVTKGEMERVGCIATSEPDSGFSLTVSPFSRDNYIVDSPTALPVEYTFAWDGSAASTVYGTMPAGIVSSSATGMDFLRYGAKVYAYVADCGGEENGVSARMYDVTDSIGGAYAVSDIVPELSSESASSFVATAIEHADGKIYLYLLAQGLGITKYVIDNNPVDDGGNTGEVDFVFETLWQNGLTTGNAPEHIDGTNAQQGAATNGIFYVNDCNDKKIYVFDEAGCIGSIAGGAGWGTACDDAGNVIVRDDKETGTNHTFIIYPAGTTVENPGEPVRVEVTVPLAGQTNFISASGDVLGRYGNIYMFPNKQNAINIISMASGKVTAVKASKEISLTGTAAGYVIPQDNNTENWIYQVRSTGFYTYNGGESELLLSGRATTTAPTRNSTGGGDCFVLSGHKILLHSSGANYKGGFTVRDMTADNVIATVDPIGTLGYETGGNYSTFNWLFAERIDAGSYHIYQYCPANGMAVYRLSDNNYSSTEMVADGFVQGNKLAVFPNPAETSITVTSGREINALTIRSIAGVVVQPDNCIIDGNRATVDVASLSPGIYVLNSGEEVAKFVKR